MVIQPRFHPVLVPLLLRLHGAGARSFHGVCRASLRLAGAGFPPGPVPVSEEQDSVRDPPLLPFLGPAVSLSAKLERRAGPRVRSAPPLQVPEVPRWPASSLGSRRNRLSVSASALAGELSGSPVAKARRNPDRRWGALWAEPASLCAQR